MIKIRHKYWKQVTKIHLDTHYWKYYTTKELADKINKREYDKWLEVIKFNPANTIEEEYKLESALGFSYTNWKNAQNGILKRAVFAVHEENIELNIKECDGSCTSQGDFCSECMEDD